MLNPDLFEELLATYPAEKREVARQVYHRFAEGDSTQFFTQLFVVLGLYAHYVENLPQAVIEANQNARAGLLKVREEIGLLAQAIDKRNLNITNQAQRTEEVCLETQERCDQITARLDSILKNVGAHIDAEAIVSGIQETLRSGINREVIAPFVNRSNELAKQVTPTLNQIREAAAEASRLWPRRIWQTAITGSLAFAAALTLVATLAISAKFKNYYEEKVAEKIVVAEKVITYNQDAFRELAIAGVQVKVIRTSDSSNAISPGGFAIAVEDPDAAEVRPVGDHKYGLIFFTSDRTEKQIQQVKQEVEKRSGASRK
jgi:hypothetical protein